MHFKPHRCVLTAKMCDGHGQKSDRHISPILCVGIVLLNLFAVLEYMSRMRWLTEEWNWRTSLMIMKW